MFEPFSAELTPREFEVAALRLRPKTFWSSGGWDIQGANGEQAAFSEREFPFSSVKWVENNEATAVKVCISGSMVICGEYDDECVRMYNVVISGPKDKIAVIKQKFQEQQGYVFI